jgi:hypothetical protein
VNPSHLEIGTKKDNRQDFMKRHPRAKELLAEASRIGAIGVQKFWNSMTKSQRKDFVARRAAAQAAKRKQNDNL